MGFRMGEMLGRSREKAIAEVMFSDVPHAEFLRDLAGDRQWAES